MNTDKLIAEALKEDIGEGDITTNAILGNTDKIIEAVIISRQNGIICGLNIAKKTFHKINENIEFIQSTNDGEKIEKNQKILTIKGSAKAILTAERTALNFLQKMSGIATCTNEFVKKAKGKAEIFDTRKTTPLMRKLDKYAVKCGGGQNHRMGLFDVILIKDNHINIAGSVKNALRNVKKNCRNKCQKIEIETETIEQVNQALEVGCDIIMLDNMNTGQIKQAVKLIRKKNKNIKIEASGGVNLQNVEKIANTKIDFISVGSITHSAKPLDLSLEIRL